MTGKCAITIKCILLMVVTIFTLLAVGEWNAIISFKDDIETEMHIIEEINKSTNDITESIEIYTFDKPTLSAVEEHAIEAFGNGTTLVVDSERLNALYCIIIAVMITTAIIAILNLLTPLVKEARISLIAVIISSMIFGGIWFSKGNTGFMLVTLLVGSWLVTTLSIVYGLKGKSNLRNRRRV